MQPKRSALLSIATLLALIVAGSEAAAETMHLVIQEDARLSYHGRQRAPDPAGGLLEYHVFELRVGTDVLRSYLPASSAVELGCGSAGGVADASALACDEGPPPGIAEEPPGASWFVEVNGGLVELPPDVVRELLAAAEVESQRRTSGGSRPDSSDAHAGDTPGWPPSYRVLRPLQDIWDRIAQPEGFLQRLTLLLGELLANFDPIALGDGDSCWDEGAEYGAQTALAFRHCNPAGIGPAGPAPFAMCFADLQGSFLAYVRWMLCWLEPSPPPDTDPGSGGEREDPDPPDPPDPPCCPCVPVCECGTCPI